LNNIVPITQARAPAAMRNRLQGGVATNRNFSDGVRDSYPMLSIKGKVFRIRVDGREEPLIDRQTRQVIPYLDVVLANASRLISKAYYVKGFSDDGDFSPPDCWSLDSVRPDPSVANKVSPTCANCPKNAFGSAPSRDPSEGKRGGKACSDARRIAVMMPGHLSQGNEPLTFLLRVPATSLKSLKAYAQLLERQGWEPAACITRLSFDYNEAYPKLVFNFVDALTDVEYDQVVQIAESPTVAAMLEAPDFDTGVPVGQPTPNAALDARVRQAAPVLQDPSVLSKVAGQEWQAQGDANVPPPRETARETMERAVPLTQATDPVIELPDGKLFNTQTGEFLERRQPDVEMPSMDANVIALPDGRFFNQKTGAFVVGPQVGAPPAGKTEEPAKRTRSRAPAKAKEAPAKAAAPEQEQQAAAQPEVAAAPAGNGGGPTVQPASKALDDILNSVLPKR
jgi:hypothetical protein